MSDVHICCNIMYSHAKEKPGPDWKTYVMARLQHKSQYEDEIKVHVFGNRSKAEEIAAFWSRGGGWAYTVKREEA